MSLNPDQIATLDKITQWVDEGRKLFDLASAFGASVIPGEPLAKMIFDGVDNLWDYADALAKGELTAIQTAVKDADTVANAELDAKFPEGT